jgi:hypothetical protein
MPLFYFSSEKNCIKSVPQKNLISFDAFPNCTISTNLFCLVTFLNLGRMLNNVHISVQGITHLSLQSNIEPFIF